MACGRRWRRLTLSEKVTVALEPAILLAAGFAAYFTAQQWRAAERALAEAHMANAAIIQQANRANRLSRDAFRETARLTRESNRLTRKSNKTAMRQAVAATKQNQQSRDEYVATHRALVVVSALIPDCRSGRLILKLKNVGPVAARNVRVAIIQQIGDTGLRRARCDGRRVIRAILPGGIPAVLSVPLFERPSRNCRRRDYAETFNIWVVAWYDDAFTSTIAGPEPLSHVEGVPRTVSQPSLLPSTEAVATNMACPGEFQLGSVGGAMVQGQEGKGAH